MNEHLKSNLTSSKLWVRLVYMLLFSFFLYIASFVVVVLIVGQFLFALLTGEDNKKLRHFGNSISIYIKDVLMFLSFNSEFKAFPFADWPEPDPIAAAEPYTTVDVVTDEVVTAEEVVEPAAAKEDDIPAAEESSWVDPEPAKHVDADPAVTDTASDDTASDESIEKSEKKFNEQSSDDTWVDSTDTDSESERKTEERETNLEKHH